MLLGDDLDSGNGCVIMDWDEFQHELALCVGLQAADLTHERAIFAGLLKNIEVAQDELAIAEHVEQARSCRALGARRLAAVCAVKVTLDEMQSHHVLTGRHRNGVGKISPAFGAVEFRIVGTSGGFFRRCKLPTFEIHVGAPPVTVVGIVRDGSQCALGEAGRDFRAGVRYPTTYHLLLSPRRSSDAARRPQRELGR